MAPRAVLVVVLALLIPVTVPALSAEEAPPARFVVGFAAWPGLAPGDAYAGGEVAEVNPALGFAVVETSDPAGLEEHARADADVVYVEPDERLQVLALTPNDPRWSSQHGPQQVRAPQAWDTSTGSTSRNVCVVDTGLRTSHEEFAGRYKGGYDFANDDSNPADDHGHGTHVTGTAAAGVNNGKGIAGIGNFGILAAKAIFYDGSGYLSDIATAIQWCADNQGHVVSMSLGWYSDFTTIRNAVTYAVGKGSLLVAAAGNDGPCTNCVNYPARYTEVLAVACTTASEAQCSFSSEGPQVDLAAAGQDILSTYHTNNAAYAYSDGTSMSTPHVSGVAALVWSVRASLTASELGDLLRATARDVGAAGWDAESGHGIPNAHAALVAPLVFADAGPDQTRSDADGDGSVGFRLDGSASYVTGGAVVSWEWYAGPTHLGSGATPDVAFAAGTTTVVTLRVASSNGATDEDTVVLTAWPNQAPVARAGPDRTAPDDDGSGDEVVRLDGTATSDDGTIASWTWKEGETVLATTPVADVAFPIGQRTVTLVVVDNAGASASDSLVVSVTPNAPPVARASADQILRDSDGDGVATARLDGRASSDDGAIVSYAWREGTTTLATGALVDVPLAVGVHTVTLEVTDSGGAIATDDLVVTVEANRPPVAAFNVSCTALVCSVDAAGSSDPDGTLAAYAWEWGDGTTGTGRNASHAYAVKGAYVVRLVVTDNGGATAAAERSVEVAAYRSVAFWYHGGAVAHLGANAPSAALPIRGTLDEVPGAAPKRGLTGGGSVGTLRTLVGDTGPESYPVLFVGEPLESELRLAPGVDTVADRNGAPWTVARSASLRTCIAGGAGGAFQAAVFVRSGQVDTLVLEAPLRQWASTSVLDGSGGRCVTHRLAFANGATELAVPAGARLVVALNPDYFAGSATAMLQWDGSGLYQSGLELVAEYDAPPPSTGLTEAVGDGRTAETDFVAVDAAATSTSLVVAMRVRDFVAPRLAGRPVTSEVTTWDVRFEHDGVAHRYEVYTFGQSAGLWSYAKGGESAGKVVFDAAADRIVVTIPLAEIGATSGETIAGLHAVSLQGTGLGGLVADDTAPDNGMYVVQVP